MDHCKTSCLSKHIIKMQNYICIMKCYFSENNLFELWYSCKNYSLKLVKFSVNEIKHEYDSNNTISMLYQLCGMTAAVILNKLQWNKYVCLCKHKWTDISVKWLAAINLENSKNLVWWKTTKTEQACEVAIFHSQSPFSTEALNNNCYYWSQMFQS